GGVRVGRWVGGGGVWCVRRGEGAWVLGGDGQAGGWIGGANAPDPEANPTGEPAWLTVEVKADGLKAFMAAAKNRLPAKEIEPFAPVWEQGRRLLLTCRGADRPTAEIRATAAPEADADAFDAAVQKAWEWLTDGIGLSDVQLIRSVEPPADRSPQPAGHEVRIQVWQSQRLRDLVARIQGAGPEQKRSAAEQIAVDVSVLTVPESLCERHGFAKNGLFQVKVVDESVKALLLKARKDSGGKCLAEPKLVTLSGQRASFLCGGPPAPDAPQRVRDHTIPLSVRLDILPTLKEDGETVHLDLQPEFTTWTPTEADPEVNTTRAH